jgi:HSP20 family protein
MNLTRWNDPFAGLTNMHSQLDDMFNSFFSGATDGQAVPAMDIYSDDDKHLVAEVHAPGFAKDDVEVNVHNGMLEIKGERREKSEDKGKKRSYVVRESRASFYRSIALPKTADADNVSAEFSDGILKVTIPLKELPAPKRVAIGDGKNK